MRTREGSLMEHVMTEPGQEPSIPPIIAQPEVTQPEAGLEASEDPTDRAAEDILDLQENLSMSRWAMLRLNLFLTAGYVAIVAGMIATVVLWRHHH